MNAEILGTIATLFVLASFSVSGEDKIRIINILGSALFVVYGYIISAHSVYILNGILCVIHVYKLSKTKFKEETEDVFNSKNIKISRNGIKGNKGSIK